MYFNWIVLPGFTLSSFLKKYKKMKMNILKSCFPFRLRSVLQTGRLRFWWWVGIYGLTGQLIAQPAALYDDTKVASIHLILPVDSLNELLDELVNDRYYKASFSFSYGGQTDVVQEVGVRLRGNTSLFAQKKSFKISFNEFDENQKYQGVRKLNLRGSHNDPTMVREHLFGHVWRSMGLPDRRSAFVRLYINNEYRGLYTNLEEIDKLWLKSVYGDNDGNLFKCTWPASLAYLGTNPVSYQQVMHDAETRAYELVTNEAEDDYTRLAALITTLNLPVNAAFPGQIESILNVDQVLRAFAIDVVTGNWDDYFYNKNNYYLYDNPVTGRFEFITFDTDNTFGIDWLGKDWTTRNCLAWHNNSDPRPLATKLLAVPAYKSQFVYYLDSLTRFVVHPDSIFPRINDYEALITDAAAEDTYRTLDYGYDLADFHAGFDQTVDSHTPYGIKPFLIQRGLKTKSQIAGLVGQEELELSQMSFRLFPNPAQDFLVVEGDFSGESIRVQLCTALGQQVLDREVVEGVPFLLTLPSGWYSVFVTGVGFRCKPQKLFIH